MPGLKLSNQYAEVLGALYEHTPKAVLGAVCVSLLSNGGDNFNDIPDALINEWRILHENGIVPQPPPKNS